MGNNNSGGSDSGSDTRDIGDRDIGGYGVDEDLCIQLHNKYRRMHGAPDLVWDDTCAQHAQMAAQVCDDEGGLRHQNGSEYNEGQNLCGASNCPDTDEQQAIDMWYGEHDDYDFNNPGFGMSTGHFTQLVWVGTTKVGMAKVGGFVAANYSIAGNMQGDFPNNVLPKGSDGNDSDCSDNDNSDCSDSDGGDDWQLCSSGDYPYFWKAYPGYDPYNDGYYWYWQGDSPSNAQWYSYN